MRLDLLVQIGKGLLLAVSVMLTASRCCGQDIGKAEAPIDALIKSLPNLSDSERDDVVQELARRGRAGQQKLLLPYAFSKNVKISIGVAHAFRLMGNAGVPAILPLLKNDSASVRIEAIDLLGFMQAPAGIIHVAALRHDGSMAVRQRVAISLGAFKHRRAAIFLLDIIENQPDERFEALLVLGGLRHNAEEAIPAITEAAVRWASPKKAVGEDDEFASIDWSDECIRCLRNIGIDAIPALGSLINNQHQDRLRAHSLGAIHTVCRGFTENRKDIAKIMKIVGKEILDCLNADIEVKLRAIRVLKTAKTEAAFAVPRLEKLLLEKEDVRIAAAGALLAIEKDHRPAIDLLVSIIENKPEDIYKVNYEIPEIDYLPRRLVPLLVKRLQSDDSMIRGASVEMLEYDRQPELKTVDAVRDLWKREAEPAVQKAADRTLEALEKAIKK